MRIAIAGASGFVGRAVARELQRSGHTIVRIGRANAKRPPDVVWDPARGELPSGGIAECEVVVNLAGATIAHRWTSGRKREILASRLESTGLLATTMASSPVRPRLFVSASAVGYYGDTGDKRVDEYSPKGVGFLADVVAQWEAAAVPARDAGIAVVHPRLGLVINASGGAVARLLLPFKLGAGGRIGTGRQWFSWVALTDAVRAIRFLIEGPTLTGAVNVVSPAAVRNVEFTAALARVLGRPARVHVPESAVRAVFGQMGEEMLLAGQQAIPRRLTAAGFKFELPDIADAFRVELANG
ncbi:MAG: Epimerase family protein [Gemmatimonadaceae bacterium]|nr:Epimerase family protein [Gemmatimonadaceae bacterium]